MLALEGPIGSGHPLGCQQRREQTVAAREGSGGALPKRQLSGARVAHGDIRYRSDGYAFADLLRRKLQQMADPGGGADTDGKSLIPTFVAETGNVAQTNKKLVGDD